MSQHIFTATSHKKSVTVTLGYDRPLDYVFCTVIDPEGRVVYSNLSDEGAGTEQQNVWYFEPILLRLGIRVPESVFEAVMSDQFLGVGNRVVHHQGIQRRDQILVFLARLLATLKACSVRLFRSSKVERRNADVDTTIDLLEVIGQDASDEPEYCSRSYWLWEERTALPRLQNLGYSDICFSMGECDSFGPLTRIATAYKDGVAHRFIYG